MPKGGLSSGVYNVGLANIGFWVWHTRFKGDVHHPPLTLICIWYAIMRPQSLQGYKPDIYLHLSPLPHLPTVSDISFHSQTRSGIFCRIWFALSLHGIPAWQPWFCYALCFSHKLFARPADQSVSPVMETLTPTFRAIQMKARVFVAVQGGPAYRIVSVLRPSAQPADSSSLLADPALINCGFLPASAQISALHRVSGRPAK